MLKGLTLGLALALYAGAAPLRAPDPIYVVNEYSPARDAEADLAAAVQRASDENKRILIVVGGDWCVWCEILDRFLASDADVHNAFAAAFVVLKVNYSRENENGAFLGRFPEFGGYPDFFILDSDGAFLAQQPTGALEQGRSYNRARMLAFALHWRR